MSSCKFIVFTILIIAPFCTPSCSMIGSSQGQPPKRFPKPAPPIFVKENEACPYYSNSYVCCNDVQIDQLKQNFHDLDMVFGSDCPICSLNLKFLWCEMTCSPNQSDFLRAENYTKWKHGEELWDILSITFRLSLDTSCDVFKSCDKVPETRMMASNGQGFIQFQVIIVAFL